MESALALFILAAANVKMAAFWYLVPFILDEVD
jgi:hypothetical protein